MGLNQILASLANFTLTLPELEKIQNACEENALRAERQYGQIFDLGDRVKVKGIGTATVVRRNKLTVSVHQKGHVAKIAPSLITDLVEAGNPDEFDYWDYFGDE